MHKLVRTMGGKRSEQELRGVKGNHKPWRSLTAGTAGDIGSDDGEHQDYRLGSR
jgi:hypothetical protein